MAAIMGLILAGGCSQEPASTPADMAAFAGNPAAVPPEALKLEKEAAAHGTGPMTAPPHS